MTFTDKEGRSLAEEVRVTRDAGGHRRIEIDGVLFPWFTAPGPLRIEGDAQPGVTHLTLQIVVAGHVYLEGHKVEEFEA